jgi:hypothetical protein
MEKKSEAKGNDYRRVAPHVTITDLPLASFNTSDMRMRQVLVLPNANTPSLCHTSYGLHMYQLLGVLVIQFVISK